MVVQDEVKSLMHPVLTLFDGVTNTLYCVSRSMFLIHMCSRLKERFTWLRKRAKLARSGYINRLASLMNGASNATYAKGTSQIPPLSTIMVDGGCSLSAA